MLRTTLQLKHTIKSDLSLHFVPFQKKFLAMVIKITPDKYWNLLNKNLSHCLISEPNIQITQQGMQKIDKKTMN